jgi:hypothetical protein
MALRSSEELILTFSENLIPEISHSEISLIIGYTMQSIAGRAEVSVDRSVRAEIRANALLPM